MIRKWGHLHTLVAGGSAGLVAAPHAWVWLVAGLVIGVIVTLAALGIRRVGRFADRMMRKAEGRSPRYTARTNGGASAGTAVPPHLLVNENEEWQLGWIQGTRAAIRDEARRRARAKYNELPDGF